MAVVPKWVGRGAGDTAVVARPDVNRRGFEFGVPRDSWGYNGSAAVTAQQQRRDMLSDYLDIYLSCVWVSRPVDTIARRITAGGVEVKPAHVTGETGEPVRPPAVDDLETLLGYINPTEDAMQFFRRVASQILVFGDSYAEVVWLLGRPMEVWGLDPITMVEDCDEHGVVTGYRQVTEDNREADFDVSPKGPNYTGSTVIHWSLDSVRGGQYGVSPVQKAMIPATAWLWNEAVIKESARRGHPGRIHANFAAGTATKTVDQWVRDTFTKVLGAKNIGAPYTTINASLNDIQPSRMVDLLDVSRQLRDEIIGCFGTSPATIGIIETGNLGGGTGEAQDKNLRVNTSVPLEAIILEKWNYHITKVGFGIADWKVAFGEIDYRDSKTIEDIRDVRLKSGAYTLNRYRQDIGEPDVDGGDDAIILTQRQGPIFWADMAEFTQATMAGLEAKAAAPAAGAVPGAVPGAAPAQPDLSRFKNAPGSAKPPSRGADIIDGGDPKSADYARESAPDETMRALEGAFDKAYRHRRRKALSEAARATAGAAEDGQR
jgi:hypothetical protein